jgi:hypothetical protein
VLLITVHTPAGLRVIVNVIAFVSAREPDRWERERAEDPVGSVLLLSAGSEVSLAVRETVDEVYRLLARAFGRELPEEASDVAR